MNEDNERTSFDASNTCVTENESPTGDAMQAMARLK